ncbi:hypothetical protein K2173_010974 [Erythroxylum novogranatense]|uniref:B-like cyclin n=1 Tax=Erythroxylum novogranatense TaxID=1862640 RepID=A0AAV8T1M9_9ROSI|nr:hypothetical protein K2173_010974 [Erythroxylum novogranatense]
MSATLVACKHEEIWAPEVNDLVCISDRAYSHEQILVMEKTIPRKLGWTLTVPTQFIKASIPDTKGLCWTAGFLPLKSCRKQTSDYVEEILESIKRSCCSTSTGEMSTFW